MAVARLIANFLKTEELVHYEELQQVVSQVEKGLHFCSLIPYVQLVFPNH